MIEVNALLLPVLLVRSLGRRLRPRPLLLFVSTMVFTLFAGFNLAAAQTPIQVSVSPLAIELHGERGATVPFGITITNNSRLQSLTFQARVTGLREGRSGDYAPMLPDAGPYAASSWVHLERQEFEVAPGQQFELQGHVQIPRDAGPSGYGAVVVELQPEARIGQAALSIEYYHQFVTALEIVVGRRHVRSAHIESMAVIPTGGAPELRAAYGDAAVLFIGTLVNDGDVHVATRGRLIIRDERGRRIREVPLGGGRGVVLPEAVVDMGSVLGGLEPGTYEMQAIVDYGGPRPAIGRMEFTLSDEAVGVSQMVAGRAVRIDATPASLLYEFPRQGYRAQTVTVINRDSVDVDFTVRLAELMKDESGDAIDVDDGVVMPYSAVAWGDVRPAAFTLRPGQRRNVVVGYRVPEGEQGGRYARVLIEGAIASSEAGTEAARSEISLDSLLVLGDGFAPKMALEEVEWRQVGGGPTVSVGATIVNEGDIHGAPRLRLSLLEYTPAEEQDMGDFVLVTGERWDIVDGVEVSAEQFPLLPGQGHFMFGTFSTAMKPGFQYQVLAEVFGVEGTRDATASLELWMDADGGVHEGLLNDTEGDDAS